MDYRLWARMRGASKVSEEHWPDHSALSFRIGDRYHKIESEDADAIKGISDLFTFCADVLWNYDKLTDEQEPTDA